MVERVRVGVVGCGAISNAYFKMATHFPILEMAACTDLDMNKAAAQAQTYSVPKVCSFEELLADDSIEVVLNLTVPKAHVPVALRAIEHGKHTWSEKPLGVNREEGRKVMEAAAARGVLAGCAPDTFLGSGQQTAREAVDEGAIGRVVAFTAFMMSPGHEHWHPNPEFYYEAGGGPMMDMGPYYLTALLNLLGPVRRVMGAASIAIPERTIGSQPKQGKKIKVETPDHICGMIEFENGAVGTIITSFATRHPTYEKVQPITLYGTEGTMRVPDPNRFDGPVHVRGSDEAEWREIPPAFVTGYGRSLGLADMAYAIRSGRRHRADAGQAFAVLDLMQGFLDSSDQARAFAPTVTYTRAAPMPAQLPFGVLDE